MSAVNPITGSSSSSAESTAAAVASTSALGDETTFLQLLVAQIQNQDPTQPIDSSTFLSQLASFSQLEQLIGIKQDTDTLTTDAGGTTSSTGSNNSTTGS
jgi:flagellar basal-body rod modification protein FlgD